MYKLFKFLGIPPSHYRITNYNSNSVVYYKQNPNHPAAEPIYNYTPFIKHRITLIKLAKSNLFIPQRLLQRCRNSKSVKQVVKELLSDVD